MKCQAVEMDREQNADIAFKDPLYPCNGQVAVEVGLYLLCKDCADALAIIVKLGGGKPDWD